jgi:four helix bundle protein
MDLVVVVYQLTEGFSLNERFGLVSQMRRSAVSIPSNIAEGAVLVSPRAFVRYLRIAAGSLSELETQLMLAGRLRIADTARVDPALRETRELRRMTVGLIKRLAR